MHALDREVGLPQVRAASQRPAEALPFGALIQSGPAQGLSRGAGIAGGSVHGASLPPAGSARLTWIKRAGQSPA